MFAAAAVEDSGRPPVARQTKACEKTDRGTHGSPAEAFGRFSWTEIEDADKDSAADCRCGDAFFVEKLGGL